MPTLPVVPFVPPSTIPSDNLCAVTGLGDRRLRQLAQEGWFPQPIESNYFFLPSLTGLFKYYREHNLRTKEKLNDTKDSKTQKENRLLDLKIAKEERKSVERAEVDKMLARGGALIKGRLYAALVREFPGKVVGRTASEISAAGKALADELCDIFASETEKWQAEE